MAEKRPFLRVESGAASTQRRTTSSGAARRQAPRWPATKGVQLYKTTGRRRRLTELPPRLCLRVRVLAERRERFLIKERERVNGLGGAEVLAALRD